YRDITERKRAEEQIRFQAHLLDVVEQAVIATDAKWRITYWNRFAEKLFGWSAAEALGRRGLTPAPGSQDQVAEILARLKRGESWSGEISTRRRDGSTFPVMITSSPILDEIGEFGGTVGIYL